nr:hypothetical protein BaRGS_009745 [Batillaria attramentaria]
MKVFDFDIFFQTPSGRQSSSKYQDGRFYLQLPNPVEGGEYSCILPSTDPATSCLPDGSLLEAALVVDEIKARLTLLEAENTDLKAENKDLKTLVNSLDTKSETLVDGLRNETKSLESSMNQKTDALERKLDNVAVTLTRRVAFHARLSKHQRLEKETPVILDNVVLNEGGAYNGTSGSFTVPYNGTYFLIVTTSDYSGSGGVSDIGMVADNLGLCMTYINDYSDIDYVQ